MLTVPPALFPAPALARIRACFPALAGEWAFFDNAGGSVPPAAVIEAVRAHMLDGSAQLGATHAHSERATARVAEGHRAAERLVGAAPGEVVLGASTTANLRLLARALAPSIAPGDGIVVTNLDHEANIGPWRALAEAGAIVREWRFRPETGALHLDDLEPLLVPRTRLVAFTHCSNVTGTLHDAGAIVRRVHEAGALACVDGVAFAPHRLVDVAAIGADFYALSLYKVFGPHLGMLWGRREALLALASQNHGFIGEHEVPYKLEPGSVPHELAAALPAILDHLLALAPAPSEGASAGERDRLAAAFDAIAAHEAALVAPLLEFLRTRPGVRVIGEPGADPARRVPTVAFAVEGRPANTIPPRLDAAKVAIRWGHFYAPRAVEALGLRADDGIVRVSMAHYNTPAEVERLLAALDAAL